MGVIIIGSVFNLSETWGGFFVCFLFLFFISSKILQEIILKEDLSRLSKRYELLRVIVCIFYGYYELNN